MIPRPQQTARRLEQAYRGMTIGLFPGSFNPAHAGHAHVAETALKRLGLDCVWWVVTPQNPWKRAIAAPPLSARVAAVRRFARGPRMIVTDIERRLNVQFSIDLIEKLRVKYPGVQFVWVMGSDNLLSFHKWRRWRDVMEEIPIAFVSRPGALARARLSLAARAYARGRRSPQALLAAPPPAWTVLDAPLVPLSSTMLRALGPRAPA